MVYFNLRSENFDRNSPITSQLARSQICGYVQGLGDVGGGFSCFGGFRGTADLEVGFGDF
jgi:hypothetical protein